MRVITLLIVALLSFLAVQGEAAEFAHVKWDGLLKRNVEVISGGKITRVDYQNIQRERETLQQYLKSLEGVKQEAFDGWNPDDQLAFLINAYNGWTVELILTKFPDLKSIKDLGSFFKSPWKKKFIPLLGETRSLDDIEHKLIRGSGKYNDPRIHFAVNCASIGCPPLRAGAYTGEKLQQQLEEATSLFLSDQGRNRYSNGKLEVSSIFKWYREDFEKGWFGIHSLEQFFASQFVSLGLNKEQVEMVESGSVKIVFLDYDWALNGLALEETE